MRLRGWPLARSSRRMSPENVPEDASENVPEKMRQNTPAYANARKATLWLSAALTLVLRLLGGPEAAQARSRCNAVAR